MSRRADAVMNMSVAIVMTLQAAFNIVVAILSGCLIFAADGVNVVSFASLCFLFGT